MLKKNMKKTSKSVKKPKTVKTARKQQTKKKIEKKKIAAKKTTSKKAGVKKTVLKKIAAFAEQTALPAPKIRKPLTERDKRLFEIRKKLVEQKEIILNEAEAALNELPGQTIFPDMGDQASAEIDRNFMLRLRGREQKLLKKIEEAIERINNGTFGICENCGVDIDIKRLEARPVTNMCIDCKTQQEEEEKLKES
ncbi:MAG: RNA polymerase-binding protein DksA [Nitrospiraceae bacterium]|nr:RNA polymerase-binding protein DksA [Nitrospiraceae bacterium]